MKSVSRLSLAFVAAAVAVAITLVAGTASAETWKEFESKVGKCAVSMPGTPTENKQTFDTEAGPVEAYLYMLETDSGDVAYLMGFNDFPADLVAQSDPQVMLDGARDGAVRNVGGKLLEEKKISINGHPGRYIKVSAPGDNGENLVFARVYLVKNRLYQALVVFPKKTLRQGDVDKFLGSFRLTTAK
jgi:hypothetical protein